MLNRIVELIRKEKIPIGSFSNRDLVEILLIKSFLLIYGNVIFILRKLRLGWFFISPKSHVSGWSKIKFDRNINIGKNVTISALGSKKFSFGKNFSIKNYSIINSFGSIKKESGELWVGDNVGVSEFCYFSIRGNLTIGNDVIFGPCVKIFTENHGSQIGDIPFRLQEEKRNDVIIGNNVWIGADVIILPGVKIGDNCIVAAGAVVTKSIDSNSKIAGVPAKLITKNI